MNYLTLDEVELEGQRVLIREDFNVPIKDGKILNDARLKAALPTIRTVMAVGGQVIIASHLGRPTEGEYDPTYSLEPLVGALSKLLECEVAFLRDWQQVSPADITAPVTLLENVRFAVGEKACDEALSKQLASLCDVFVMDAFATAHRAQASTVGVAKYAKHSCAGLLLDRELSILQKSLSEPKRPLLAIVGGAKVSTKLTVLQGLLSRVDQLIVGGGIANTLLLANGYPVGQSLVEPSMLDVVKDFLESAKANNKVVPMPVDVRVGSEFSDKTKATVKLIEDVSDDDMIFDIGPQTQQQYAKMIQAAQTIVWNGPVGVFEFAEFAHGTKAVSQAIAKSKAYSLAGGGETITAIDKFKIRKDINYISTGGGAFLEFLEGKPLPAVEALSGD